VPELCKAYTPGKTDQDLPQRVFRLEQIIEAAFPNLAQYDPAIGQSIPGLPMGFMNTGGADDDESRSQTEESDPAAAHAPVQQGRMVDGKWYGETVSGSVAPGSVLEQVRFCQKNFSSVGALWLKGHETAGQHGGTAIQATTTQST
jgi:hypothetical protein